MSIPKEKFMKDLLKLLKDSGVTDEQIQEHRKMYEDALSKATKEDLIAITVVLLIHFYILFFIIMAILL